MTAIIQHTPEWHEARRRGVTSTDIVAILGLSRYGSEGDLAREKLGADPRPPDDPRQMRLGLALEDVVRQEDEVEHGHRLRRVRRLVVHPDLPWAMTSLDFERVGERTLVEVKTTTSRAWDDGLPEYVEAQVRWQMGVARYPRAHVAALRFGRSLSCHDLEHDPVVFDRMLTIAADFMSRLAAGGPFEESAASARRAFPMDDGSTVVADSALEAAVAQLVRVRADLEALASREEDLRGAIQTKMAEASLLLAPPYRVTWRRSRGWTETSWPAIAEELLGRLPEPEREAVTSRHSQDRPGRRQFRVTVQRERQG